MGYKTYSVCVQIVFCAAYTRRFVRSEFRLFSSEAHLFNIRVLLLTLLSPSIIHHPLLLYNTIHLWPV